MKNGSLKKHVGLDIMRVIAMLSVIFLHTIYSFTVRTDFFLTRAWFLFEPLAVISRSSMALFFMISGYLVVHKNRTVGENLKVTFHRIVVPFFFFSLFASVFYLFKSGRPLSDFVSPSYIFADVMKFPDNWLWFLEVMFFLYILNPLWQELFNDNAKRSIAQYVTIYFFLFTIITVLLKFITHTLFFFNSYTTWVGYVCCYLYGALAKNKWGLHKSTFLSISLFIVGFLLQMAGDYISILSQKNGVQFYFAGYFVDYLAIPSLLMALGLFNYFIQIKSMNVGRKSGGRLLSGTISLFASLSYGIYLTHQFIALSLYDIVGLSVDTAHINIYLFYSLIFAATLFGSATLTFFISRIPKLRMIIGNTA